MLRLPIGTLVRHGLIGLAILGTAATATVMIAWWCRNSSFNGNRPASGIRYVTPDGAFHAYEYSMRAGVTTRGVFVIPAGPEAREVSPRSLPAWSVAHRLRRTPEAIMAQEDVSGWPWRALYLHSLAGTNDHLIRFRWRGREVLLPTGVAWGGFLANTASLAVPLFAAVYASAALRRRHRRRRGACLRCGYLVRDALRCPECGTPTASSAR